LWQRSCSQVAKHGPEFAADAAVDATANTAADAVFGHDHESPREWKERTNDEFFDDN
jgi:hypothetical protein